MRADRVYVTDDGPKLAESYRLHEKGLDIDGKQFPWFVAERGPEVERTPQEGVHILWVPILVEAYVLVERPATEPIEPPEADQ